MRNDILFECLRRILERHETASAIDTETAAMMIQRSRGDATYSLGVAVAFRSLAGDKWPVFCDIYDTTKNSRLTDRQMRICNSHLQRFWRAVKKSKYHGEFEAAARWYMKQLEAA